MHCRSHLKAHALRAPLQRCGSFPGARAPAGPITTDTHHHLWDDPNNRYLIDEITADLQCGHNIVGTVFLECSAMWRAAGPVEMRPVGETEFEMGTGAALMWNAFKRFSAGASPAEKLALFSGTARRVYRLL